MNEHDLAQALDALQRRVEALEEENTFLRQQTLGEPRGTSRRHLLAGGAGMVGALAAGALLGSPPPSVAAATPVAPPMLRLSVTLAPVRTQRAVWAEHVWPLGAHFKGEPPVVVASAYDDAMEHDVALSCTCAAVVRGKPGAYEAHLLVRQVSRSARAVVVHALAVGP